MATEKKLKIFIVYHKHIFFEHYEKDEKFSEDIYTFCKIDRLPNAYDMQNMIDVNEFSNFVQLESQYNEYQAIYNIYKNPDIWKDLDYIGFSQYDKPHLFRVGGGHNVTEKILDNLDPETHISLESYPFMVDFNQHILMDEEKPDILVGRGKNVYFGILEDYNAFYGTNYSLVDLQSKNINLVSSFVLPAKTFENIMPFIANVIESGKLNKFDAERRNRVQAGFLERYMGVAIIFENLKQVDLTTEHFNQK